jgi:uroporphyrinogen decarboxylase
MKKIIETLNGKISDIPPIWLMRQAGRYLPEYLETRAKAGSFLELCYSPELAAEVTLQPLRRFNFDAAILFSDILVVPHALGQELSFAENHGPILGERPSEFIFDENEFHQKLNPVYQAIETIQYGLQKEGFEKTALIGFSGSPWTLACYMVDKKGSKDFALTRLMALREEEVFTALINNLVTAISAYCIRQIRHGAEIIQLFDSWAGVLPESQFQKWVINPTARIVENIKKVYPETPVIGFPKGAGLSYVDYVKNTKVKGVGIDAQTPLNWVREHLQPLITIQGNLDPFTLAAGGQTLLKETDAILEKWSGLPFIFNLGHGIDKSTPPANVLQLVNHIRGHKK